MDGVSEHLEAHVTTPRVHLPASHSTHSKLEFATVLHLTRRPSRLSPLYPSADPNANRAPICRSGVDLHQTVAGAGLEIAALETNPVPLHNIHER